jgi:hypothetical protein
VNLFRTGQGSTRCGSIFYIESIAGSDCPDDKENAIRIPGSEISSTVRYRGGNWATPQFEFEICPAETTSRKRHGY